MRRAICEAVPCVCVCERMAVCLSRRRNGYKWNWAHEQKRLHPRFSPQSTSITHVRTPQATERETLQKSPDVTCPVRLDENIHSHDKGVGGEIRATSVGSHPLLSRVSYSPLPLLSTSNAVSEPRWEIEKKKKKKARESKGNGGTSVRWDWISSKRWRERLRHEKGVLIGIVSVGRLLKKALKFSLSTYGFCMCFSLFFSFSFRLFFSAFPRQQPYVRVQTQGEWTALPPAPGFNCPPIPLLVNLTLRRRKRTFRCSCWLRVRTRDVGGMKGGKLMFLKWKWINTVARGCEKVEWEWKQGRGGGGGVK